MIGFAIRRPRRMLATWIILAIAGLAASHSLSSALQRAFTAPGSDSARAAAVLKRSFPGGGEYPFLIVAPTATSHAYLERAAHLVASQTHGAALAAQNVTPNLAYAAVASTQRPAALAPLTPKLRAALNRLGGHLLLTGVAPLEYDSRSILNEDLAKAELIALPLAAIILLLLLQTIVAALIPVVVAGFVIPTSMGVIWLLAHVTTMSIYVTNVATLLGVALSLDYTLLVVSRLRHETATGSPREEALRRAMTTAGRTAVLSAVTVATGLAVLLLIPLPFMRSMGLSGVVVPLVAAAATSTVLPCVLKLLGDRIDKGRIVPNDFGATRMRRARALAERVKTFTVSHPLVVVLATCGFLVALAAPLTAISITGGDIRSLPRHMPADQGLTALTKVLGDGAVTPYEVVLEASKGQSLKSEKTQLEISQLLFALSKDHEIVDDEASPIGTRISQSGRAAELVFIGRHASGSPAAAKLVHRLRGYYNRLRPAGTHMYVGGAAALSVDFVENTYNNFLWIVLGVLAVSIVMLTLALRSIVLPVKAAVLNILSVGATIGFVVLVVQTGADTSIGLRSTSQVEAWVPAFLVAVLFGLATDYHIIIVSRIREEWTRCGDTSQAVTSGLAQTNAVVRAAAAVMAVTFAGFMTSSFADVQKLGIGLTAGVIIDVLVVRGLLVPAAMRWVGDWNWYMPGRKREDALAAPVGVVVEAAIGETYE